jgi:hypothetical protein
LAQRLLQNDDVAPVQRATAHDIDLGNVDFSAIPRNGSSGSRSPEPGGVLWRRRGWRHHQLHHQERIDLPPSLTMQGAVGSYGYKEGSASVGSSQGNFSGSVRQRRRSDGYRVNKFDQTSGTGDFRWTNREGTTAYSLTGDDRFRPAGRRLLTPTNLVITDPRGSCAARFRREQGTNVTTGVARNISRNPDYCRRRCAAKGPDRAILRFFLPISTAGSEPRSSRARSRRA